MNYYPIAGYKITYSVATLSYDNCYTNLRDYSNLVCPCEVYLLKLENFEILCCCVLVSSWTRALEVIVTFWWRYCGDPPFFVWSDILLVYRKWGYLLPHVKKLCSVHNNKVTRRARWRWWDFVTHGTSLWLVEALWGKSNTMTGRDLVTRSIPRWSSNTY
jgi:hypothetical protein